MSLYDQVDFIQEPLSLGAPTAEILGSLCQTLWEWENCASCSGSGCSFDQCDWSRKQDLQAYLQFYEEIACGSRPKDYFEAQQAIRNHGELISIIGLIKNRPNCTRKDLMQQNLAAHLPIPSQNEQIRSFDLAMRVLTTLECGPSSHLRTATTEPYSKHVWTDDETAISFVQSAFDMKVPQAVRPFTPTAKKLRDFGITVLGTDNLRDHLLYSPGSKTLQIFRFTAFLREHLRQFQCENPVQISMIPRRLAFETLHSQQFILFPWHNTDCGGIAKKAGLDKASSEFDALDYAENSDWGLQYVYWGDRMRILSALLEQDMPCNAFVMWLSRRSRLQLVTLFMTVFVAMLTFATLLVEALEKRNSKS